MDTPPWLARRLVSLHRTGQLTLNNEREFDVQGFSAPKFVPELAMIKHLSIVGLQITSLEGFPVFPRLQSFTADRTKINTFVNFTSVSRASKISLRETPISHERTYKLSLLVVCSNQLSSIDGQMISPSLRKRGEDWPECAKEMVNKGWVVEWPKPDASRWSELRHEYSIELIEEDSLDALIDADVEDWDMLSTAFRSQQEAMFANAEGTFRPMIPSFEDELLTRLCMVFDGGHGIAVPEDPAELLRKLEEYCQKAKDAAAQMSV
jgi:hypothetical protein